MSLKFQVLRCLVLGMTMATAAVSVAASVKTTPIKRWRGYIKDESLIAEAPRYITNQETLTRVWKSWKLPGRIPKLNEKTQFLVVATNRGSGLTLDVSIDINGDLTTESIMTREILPGFRYVIYLLSRRGVKTVDGKSFSELAAGGGAPGKETRAKVTGTVIYRERIALPPEAVAEVSLVDVSRADAPAVVLDKQEIKSGRQVPIPFSLSYNPADIKPNFTYAVQARILVKGKVWFHSTSRHSVITQGAPTNIEILVQRAP